MAYEHNIMGIDPGLAAIGWALLSIRGRDITNLVYGCIRTNSRESLPERLSKIHTKLRTLVKKYNPDSLAIEELIFSSNQLTAIHVAQARGVCILSCAEMGVRVYEYSPLEIKRSIAGYGRASKEQVQKMVMQLLHLDCPPTPSHASDAIATALCHFFRHRLTYPLLPR